MKIAVDFTLPPLHAHFYWKNLWLNIAAKNAVYQFYFIGKEGDQKINSSNIKWITLPATSFHVLGKNAADKKQLQQQLILLGTDVWITNDLLHVIKGGPQQFLYAADFCFTHHPTYYHKKQNLKTLQQALPFLRKIVVPTNYQQQYVQSIMGVDKEKIHIAGIAVSSFATPLTWPQQESVKTQYAAGKDYFLYNSTFYTVDEVLQALKAFSIFKKWQQSSMQLIFSLEVSIKNNFELQQKIETYKYRQDVHFVAAKTEEDMLALTGAAYALITNNNVDNNLPIIVNAAAANIPVICNASPQIDDLFDKAVMIADVLNIDALAQKMILMYKDDHQRKQLIQSAYEISQSFTINKTVQQWNKLLYLPANANA